MLFSFRGVSKLLAKSLGSLWFDFSINSRNLKKGSPGWSYDSILIITPGYFEEVPEQDRLFFPHRGTARLLRQTAKRGSRRSKRGAIPRYILRAVAVSKDFYPHESIQGKRSVPNLLYSINSLSTLGSMRKGEPFPCRKWCFSRRWMESSLTEGVSSLLSLFTCMVRF